MKSLLIVFSQYRGENAWTQTRSVAKDSDVIIVRKIHSLCYLMVGGLRRKSMVVAQKSINRIVHHFRQNRDRDIAMDRKSNNILSNENNPFVRSSNGLCCVLYIGTE